MAHPIPLSEHAALLADLATLADVGELTIEDFSIIDTRYRKLAAAGVEFAPEFVLLMRLLEVQAQDTDDDPDSDLCVDEGQEHDDIDAFGDVAAYGPAEEAA